jgi:hypothetical protein
MIYDSKMMTCILITVSSLLVLVAFAAGQERKTAPPQTPWTEINSSANSLEQFSKHSLKTRRLFGNTAGNDDQQDHWRAFKTARQLEQAGLDESAYVWLKDNKPVVAKLAFTSSSGDWFHFVTYYFRDDGSLAKIHAQLNTFASAGGGVSVVREKFYDANGKLLHESTRYLDMKTQRPRKRTDFMDQPIPVYKTVREAPFAKLLRS